MIRSVGISVLVAVIVATAILYCPVPWSAILTVAAVLLGYCAWSTTLTNLKLLSANLAAVVAAVAVFEGFLGFNDLRGDGTRMEGTISEGFVVPDDDLGYRPRVDSRVTARKLFEDRVIYDVTYSIGADGLRVTPRSQSRRPPTCTVFFGDSVTFGEGVNDAETYPFRVGVEPRGETSVYNFAFSGYGPHQALAALNAGRVERTVTCSTIQFVHLAIVEHVARVAGLAGWDRHGPRFRLNKNGTVERDGNFDDPTQLLGRWVLPRWFDQTTDRFRTWHRFFGRSRDANDADFALYLGVLDEVARVARSRFPGSSFDLLLWDRQGDTRFAAIERRLTGSGVVVHRLTTMIPDFAANADRYLLGPRDGHPNALMHQRIGEYVSREIVNRTRP